MTKLKQIKTDKHTIKSAHLDVGDGHKIWFEQWGNPSAQTPVLFFHGGPGHFFAAEHKYRTFDPKVHQVIGFDQRGAGNSVPYGKLEHNTTADILNDANKILEHLGVEQVYIFGGSWGSTLALLYTLQNQGRVKATIINGVFTASSDELDYVDKGYYRNVYPEVWQRIQASVPAQYHDNPSAYHYKILAGKDKTKILASAKALQDMEVPLMLRDWRGYNDIQKDKDPDQKESEYDYVPYQIYAHYLANGCFLDENYILNNAHRIKTPLYIVQGRYDMCCPPIAAFKIHQSVQGSKLYVTLGSHMGSDAENRTPLKILADTVLV